MLVLGWFSVDFISLYFAIINGLTTRTYKGDLRIRNPLSKNGKLQQNKDLPQAETGAYKPAYKNISEIAKNKTQIDIKKLPTELAEIVTVWHELPEHIKAAIKALVQTHKETK